MRKIIDGEKEYTRVSLSRSCTSLVLVFPQYLAPFKGEPLLLGILSSYCAMVKVCQFCFVERGERSVGLVNLWKLADALEISPVKFYESIVF